MATRRGPDGTARVAVSGNRGTEAWANVFWANLTGFASATQANFDTWVSNFGEAYYNSFGPQLQNGVNITLAQGTLFTPGETALHSAHVMAHTGNQTGAAIADMAASPVISWVTTVYWRGGKPRTYLPSVMQSETADAKTLTTVAQTAYGNAGAAFHSAVNALTVGPISQTQHGFVSFRSGNADRPVPLFFPINAARCHGRFGTQRRRLGPWIA